MKRRLKEPFGKAGLTVAVIALVMALIGGAYAAGGLTKSQEKQVKKIAKKYAGKPGAAGATGPAGAAGPGGPAGKEGAQGEQGVPGAPGAAGKSVEAENAPVAKCSEGGTVFKVGGTEVGKACNGEEGVPGAPGSPGSPWTAGGTLPKGATEKGNWSVTPVKFNGGPLRGFGPVSFGIPLKSAPTIAIVNGAGEEGLWNPTSEEYEFGTAANCLGSLEDPEAAEGFLCVYINPDAEFGQTLLGEQNSYATGASLHFSGEHEGVPIYGSWAVTSSE
jgi:hypothetical protein